MLKHPVTLSQVAVPILVCYVVSIDAPSNIVTAILEECHGRWGGRDSLIIPMNADGSIDECYWDWARDIDPDVVYSYVELNVPTLERIQRDLMPSVVTIHRLPDDPRVRHELEAEGVSALSLLPMLAATYRLGQLGPMKLVSAFREWPRDPFITDSFGLNPYGPEFATAGLVRKYVETLALGSQEIAPPGHVADISVANTISLLENMSQQPYGVYTMAQLSGMGYENVHFLRASVWKWFNIIVGDTTLDRIAFWNGRVGAEGHQRKHVTAIRVPEAHLDNPQFMSVLATFVSRWNSFQDGQAFASVRSSSVVPERLRPFAEALAPLNVIATVEMFSDATACSADPRERNGVVTGSVDERFTESKAALVPNVPRHLRDYGPMDPWLSHGAWTIQVALKRQTGAFFGATVPPMPIPRRLQAVRSITEGSTAKVTRSGSAARCT